MTNCVGTTYISHPFPSPLFLSHTSKTKKFDSGRIIIQSLLRVPKKLCFFRIGIRRAGPNVQTASLSFSFSPFRKLVFYHRIFRLLIPRFNGAREYDVVDVSIKKLHRCIRVARYMSHGLSERLEFRTGEEKSRVCKLKIAFKRDNCVEIYCLLFGPHASFRRDTIFFSFL